ncbi:MAG TPA: FHA domain-containing protein [Solirubrobacteraceae bacterium]|jgi:2-phospho-L-lactate guanylyltransferase (CobY/MobA/RfbA family)|nr:FHA domain-containing protein [Solirubrobacteraceae bacterium]
MTDVRLIRQRESILEQLAGGYARGELSEHTHEARVEAALAAASLRELQAVTWDLPTLRDQAIALLRGTIDGIEVVADGRWLARDATHTSWLLGRHEHCDVRFTSQTVSRHHALVTKRGRAWSIVDLEATNGTLVNGARIRRRRLTPGDNVELGAGIRLSVTGTRHFRWI